MEKVYLLTIKHDTEMDSDVVILKRPLTQDEETRVQKNILKYKKTHEDNFDPCEMMDVAVCQPFSDIVIHIAGYNYVNAENMVMV